MSTVAATSNEEILRVIVEFADEHHYNMTVRELMEALNLRSPSTVHVRLRQLRKRGWVSWVDGASRTLVVTEGGIAHLNETP
jgi:repressor LexA